MTDAADFAGFWLRHQRIGTRSTSDPFPACAPSACKNSPRPWNRTAPVSSFKDPELIGGEAMARKTLVKEAVAAVRTVAGAALDAAAEEARRVVAETVATTAARMEERAKDALPAVERAVRKGVVKRVDRALGTGPGRKAAGNSAARGARKKKARKARPAARKTARRKASSRKVSGRKKRR
jgi:hypothetical protein